MKNKILVIIYYAILLLLYASWNNLDSVPGAIMRIGYFAAVIFPCFVWVKDWYVMVISTFTSLAMLGYSSSYMPVMPYSYLLVTIIFVLINRNRCFGFDGHLLSVFIITAVYVTLVNMFEGELYPISTTMALSILLLLLFDNNSENSIQVFSYAFIAISIVMSIQFFLIGKDLVTVYSRAEGLERQGFSDINYSACVVGMGVFASVVELFRHNNKTITKILLAFAIMLFLITMSLNASRGSMLAVALSIVIVLFYSKIKTRYKILSIIAIALAIFYLYTNDYLDLLIYRIQNDEGQGGNRGLIWRAKFAEFTENGNIIMWLFGVGLQGARDLANGVSTHNDFLSFLFSYGIIGFGLFLYLFFIYPFKHRAANKVIILAALAYLSVCCFTLEPIAKGYHSYYYFWLYIIMMTIPSQEQIEHN